jgi:hypothetical protein
MGSLCELGCTHDGRAGAPSPAATHRQSFALVKRSEVQEPRPDGWRLDVRPRPRRMAGAESRKGYFRPRRAAGAISAAIHTSTSSEERWTMSVERIESKIAEHRAARDAARREVAELQSRRKELLLIGDIGAIEELDRKIRRLGIVAEIAVAKGASFNANLYLARAERQRWANVSATNFVMPDSDELARLIEIVREAEPDLAFDDDSFKRAFWACGQMWRADALDKGRYFVSYVDDATDMLRMRRQSGVTGSAFLAAIIAHGDVYWQREDPALGVVQAAALDKNHGRPCSNRWRDIITCRASLLEPVTPGVSRAHSDMIPRPKFYEEGSDGRMHEFHPAPHMARH